MAPPKKNKRETVPEFDDIKDDEPSDMKLLADGTFAVIMPPTAIDKLRIRCEWCKKTMKYSYAKKHFIKTSNDACVYWEDYEKWLNEKATAETSNDEEDDGISLPFNKERERASDDESSNGDGEEEPAPKKLPAIKKKKSSSRPLPKRAASTEPASAQRSKKKQKAASSPRTPSRRSTYDNHKLKNIREHLDAAQNRRDVMNVYKTITDKKDLFRAAGLQVPDCYHSGENLQTSNNFWKQYKAKRGF